MKDNDNFHFKYTEKLIYRFILSWILFNLKIQYKKKEMSRLFSIYMTPQIKEIYHPEIIQEWKLNIDAAEYEKYG